MTTEKETETKFMINGLAFENWKKDFFSWTQKE